MKTPIVDSIIFGCSVLETHRESLEKLITDLMSAHYSSNSLETRTLASKLVGFSKAMTDMYPKGYAGVLTPYNEELPAFLRRQAD